MLEVIKQKKIHLERVAFKEMIIKKAVSVSTLRVELYSHSKTAAKETIHGPVSFRGLIDIFSNKYPWPFHMGVLPL